MAIIVTATMGGSTANGLVLRVYALTGALPVSGQTGHTAGTAISGTAFTASIANGLGSSIYIASANGQASDTTTGSNSTVVDSVSDSGNGMRYVTCKATGLSAGTTTRGYTVSPTSTSGPLAMLEVLPATTLAEDASAASAVASTTADVTVSTPPFTPPAGSLLVALVGSDGGTGVTTMTVANDGTNYNWAEKVLNNPAGGDYAGVWIADVPSGGLTQAAGLAGGTGAAYNATPQTGLSAGPLYAGSATAVSGSWAGTGNAVGSTQGDYATWADSGAGTSAALELAAFGADSAVPAGSTVNSVQCTVRHGETPASAVASVTAQAYSGTTPVGSAQALTAADAVHEDTVTFTGLTYADLADLRVRVTVTRD